MSFFTWSGPVPQAMCAEAVFAAKQICLGGLPHTRHSTTKDYASIDGYITKMQSFQAMTNFSARCILYCYCLYPLSQNLLSSNVQIRIRQEPPHRHRWCSLCLPEGHRQPHRGDIVNCIRPCKTLSTFTRRGGYSKVCLSPLRKSKDRPAHVTCIARAEQAVP